MLSALESYAEHHCVRQSHRFINPFFPPILVEEDMPEKSYMEFLREMVSELGSQRAAARALGHVKLQAQISHTLNGRRPPS